MDWFKKARRPIAASVEPSRVPEGLRPDQAERAG